MRNIRSLKKFTNKYNLLFVCILAVITRVLLSNFGTLELDFNSFRGWSQNLVNNGFGNFYNSWSDYLPGYLYVLWLLGKINLAAPFIPEVLLYKLPAILADIGTGILIFSIVSKFRKKLAILAVFVYLFNPAIIFNSTLWGQVDSLTILSVLLSVFFTSTKPTISVISLAIGALIKPQAGFIAPIIAILWFKKYGLMRTILNTFLSATIFVIGFIPFTNGKNIFTFVAERLNATAGQYPYASVNAFNFWALVGGLWQKDDITRFVGIIIITVITIILIHNFVKNFKNSNRYLLAACMLIITFLFLTRMHERHLLPVFAPLLISAVEFPLLFIPYVLLSLTYILNLQYSFVWISQDFHQIFGKGIITLTSGINLLCTGLVVLVFLKPKNFQSPVSRFQSITNLKLSNFLTSWKLEIGNWKIPHEIPSYLTRPLLIGVLFFALISRLVGLWYPNTFYFDEVYHAWTAREMLRGNPAAWEWWNTPPEGFAYEWSHPPVAKLFMWGSMYLLGDNSFAWRLPSALLGSATILLVYLLGFQLIKNRTIALFSAAIFALDGLSLVMSRIGMNDTYFLFFALLCLLLFLREKYFLASIFLGLAAASKWTVFWVLPILFLAMLFYKNKPRFNIFWFFIIPPFIYLVSYIPFFLTGHDWRKFIELQQQMWWYHTSLHATHAYGSSALSWPLMLRPVWFFVEYPSAGSGLISNIYAMGNPIVFWGGLFSTIMMAAAAFVKKQKVLLFVVISWMLMFLPWAASPRIMFLYHYYPAVPFLSLTFGWYLSQQKKRVILLTYCLLTIAYVFFFPHWTGITIPKWWDDLYYIIPSWK